MRGGFGSSGTPQQFLPLVARWQKAGLTAKPFCLLGKSLLQRFGLSKSAALLHGASPANAAGLSRRIAAFKVEAQSQMLATIRNLFRIRIPALQSLRHGRGTADPFRRLFLKLWRRKIMARRKILVVEDEYLLADDCVSEVLRAGFEVAGPFGKLEDVQMDLHEIAGALLDINVRGTAVYPLLDRLLELNIPVTIYSGYEAHNLPAQYAGLPLVTKPHGCAEAVKTLCGKLNG
jgi:hypothetical protein